MTHGCADGAAQPQGSSRTRMALSRWCSPHPGAVRPGSCRCALGRVAPGRRVLPVRSLRHRRWLRSRPPPPLRAAKPDQVAPASEPATSALTALPPAAPTSAAKPNQVAPASGSATSALAVLPPAADRTSLPPPGSSGSVPLPGAVQRGFAGDSGRAAGGDSDHRRLRAPSSSRAVPAAVKRAVWERDQARCGYVDPLTGRRCTAQHLLQIDHLQPVCQGRWRRPGKLAPLMVCRPLSHPQEHLPGTRPPLFLGHFTTTNFRPHPVDRGTDPLLALTSI